MFLQSKTHISTLLPIIWDGNENLLLKRYYFFGKLFIRRFTLWNTNNLWNSYQSNLCVRLLGFEKLMSFIVNEWLSDIKKNQLPSLLGGVGPMYSVVQLCKSSAILNWICTRDAPLFIHLDCLQLGMLFFLELNLQAVEWLILLANYTL